MATRCENFLIVSHKEHQKMLDLESAFISDQPFVRVAPCAEAFESDVEKYDYGITLDEITVPVAELPNLLYDKYELIVRFYSSGWFPREWYKCMRKMGYNIKAYWTSDSELICGKWINGRCSGEIPNSEAPKGIRDNLLWFP